MTPEFLRRRNTLWARLRSLPPSSPEFETALRELSALIGWDRVRVLAGLGLSETQLRRSEDAAPEKQPPEKRP